jgi:hypothetical protein
MVNSVFGFLLLANGFLLVGFTKVRKDGVKNYFRRTFDTTPVSYTSADESDIVADVQQYISERSEENRSTKAPSGVTVATALQIAQTYKEKGDHTINLKAKAKNYSLALLELEKLPLKDSKVVKQTKPVKQQLKALLQSISTVGIKLGDNRQQIELLYGLADRAEVSDRYYPIGSISYLTYDNKGLQFGLRNNRVFAINIRSNFDGVVSGVQIGDNIDNIQALHKGRRNEFPGSNFAYQNNRTKDQQLTFVFSNQDDLVDGVKLFDKKLYGSWETVLQ